jgi:hypothetical protein
MSLSIKIAAAVDALSGAGVSPPYEAAAEAAGARLTLHLTAAGAVGLAFDALEFTAADRAERSPEALRAWADRLADRLTYLMEPLAVLEHDLGSGELVLRSQTPTARDGRRTFYEVRLRRDGTMRLGRVAFDDSARTRTPAPCRMTVEALERLADDLVACAG